jgi:hypothetical protein
MTKLRNLQRSLALAGAAATLVFGVTAAGPARAAVQVEGDAAALRIAARQAPVAEILAALGNALKIRYRAAAPLDGVIDGTYRGSLREVLADVLEDYNYVIKTADGQTEVVVIGRRGQRPMVAPPAPAGLAANPATQWRTPTQPRR